MLVYGYERFFRKRIDIVETIHVSLTIENTEHTVICICDTGNFLRDPLSDMPIVLITQSLLKEKYGLIFNKESVSFKNDRREIRGRFLPASVVEGDLLLPIIGRCKITYKIGEKIIGPCGCTVGVVCGEIKGSESCGLINPLLFNL